MRPSSIYFFMALFFWYMFAYDIENDRDIYTWFWLLGALYMFTNSFFRYYIDVYEPEDKKQEKDKS